MDLVSTSYAERQNLNIRMKNRRFTRLTNAFSKKAENLAYSIALDFMHHNFVRKHMTLKTTPARAAWNRTGPGRFGISWNCCQPRATKRNSRNHTGPLPELRAT